MSRRPGCRAGRALLAAADAFAPSVWISMLPPPCDVCGCPRHANTPCLAYPRRLIMSKTYCVIYSCLESMRRGWRMDLLQLHYFRTVARLEHVTRAAEELGVAQPALSKTMARLEAELGMPLFDRRGRRV